MWNLPTAIEIDGKEYAITNKCDYRMVLDVICALNDNDLDDEQKIRTALYIFYEDISECTDIEKAIKEMYKIISYGEEQEENQEQKPKLKLIIILYIDVRYILPAFLLRDYL